MITALLVYLLIGALIWLPLCDHHVNYMHVWYLKRGKVVRTFDLAFGIVLLILGWPLVVFYVGRAVFRAVRG